MPVLTITLSGCAGCCDEPYLVVGDCESFTGTATICGFSGYSSDADPYDPMFPDDWEGQYRKWRDKTLGGGWEYFVYGGPGCDTECVSALAIDYEGVASITCDASTPVTVDLYGTCELTFIETDDVYESLLQVDGTETKTLTVRTITYSGECFESGGSPSITTGGTTDTLSEEQYLYDALAALYDADPEGSGVTVGDSCCSTLTLADQTTPESQSPISLTGTAARVPITLFGCDPVGAIYPVYITLEQGASTYVIDIEIPCMIPSFYYVPLAAPGEDPICFVSASLEAP